MIKRFRRPAIDATTALALLVSGALFMENLDGTVIVTALPAMGLSFGRTAVDLNVGLSAYMLTLAMLIPASGWVTDRWGARKVFITAIVIFTLSSALCGFSQNLATFTAARILQGIGGAMMVPVGRLVILRTTAKADLMRAIALITWPALVAPILGPPIGGLITDALNWRWIFFLNLPLGVIAFAFSLRLVKPASPSPHRPFDILGFILIGGSCLGIMAGIDKISQGDSTSVLTWAILAGSFIVGVVAVLHARRHPTPLVEIGALKVRTYSVSILGGSLFRIAINAVPFLLPLMFQIGFGLPPVTSGLLLMAVFAGNLCMKPMTSWVLRRFGFKPTLIGNGLIAGASLLGCALLTPSTPIPLVIILLFIGGMARSMQFTAINTIAFADVEQRHMSGANTLFNVAQQMSFGLGIALGAVALRLGQTILSQNDGTPSLAAFHIAFVIIGLIGLAAVTDALGLAASSGEGLGGGAQKK